MTYEIILILSISIGMILLFVFELLPVEAIGLLVMVAVIVFGLVSPEEGVSGFSNQAIITILALMIISAGLDETGAVQLIGQKIKGIFELPEWQSIGLLMLIVGVISAFINTTAVVIVFLSVLLRIADKIPTHLSKLLIPLSFACILGGSCSLMGTSTNLLVSSISNNAGLEPFGFFEFTPIGVGIFVTAYIYMVALGRHFLPEREQSRYGQEDFYNKSYSTLITLKEGSSLTEKPLYQTAFYKNEDQGIIAVRRGDDEWRLPQRYEVLKEGDRLLIRANAAYIKNMLDSQKISIPAEEKIIELDEKSSKFILCEALIKPSSKYIGRRFKRIDLSKEYNMVNIGVHQVKKAKAILGKLSPSKALNVYLREDSIEVGDSLLVLVNKSDVEELSNTRDFVLLSQFRELHFEKRRIILSVAILIGVIVLAATNILPIMVSALAGALAMALSGCITLNRSFRSVNWGILFLLAGMIPLGIAMNNTGADKYLAEKFIELLPSKEPMMIIGSMFFFTALLSSVLSNNATAILLAPIAISLATQLGVPPKALLFAVMFGANTSYFTPIGYQTNTLIYNPGNYRFGDFFVVGGLLTLIVCAVGTFLIYWFVY